MIFAEAVDRVAANLAEATANLDDHIDTRALAYAEVMVDEAMVPMGLELAELQSTLAMEIQRREDLTAEFRRQINSLIKQRDSAEPEVQAWRTTSDHHQPFWKGHADVGYCIGCLEHGVRVLSPCWIRTAGEDAITTTAARVAKRALAS